MNQNTIEVLEYNKVLEKVENYAFSETAKTKIRKLQPSINPEQIKLWLNETTEARRMIDINSSVPLTSMEKIQDIQAKFGKEMILSATELETVRNLLDSVKRLRKYMSTMEFTAPQLSSYAASMYELDDLREEIYNAIANGEVLDHASSELNRIRKRIRVVEDRIRQKLNEFIRSTNYQSMLQEAIIIERAGRYAIPVRRQFQKSFPGSVIDTSSTGSTVFMEPTAVSKFQNELNALKAEEETEVYRILSYLTALAEMYSRELSINIETIAHYDFVLAKAKYSQALNMRAVDINTRGRTILYEAKHPLLEDKAVPLDFSIGDGYRALLITGPNTGGKTVALKNVGLLTLMVQSGMHIPVGAGSQVAVFTDILVDIGDGQSIEQSLSTFSSHVKNIHTIIECAAPDTLVIMDELGSGTDPAEGRGFAIAVLEEVFNRGAAILATTHFGELKEFASRTEGFINGRMEFDPYTLNPLFRLSIGTWGESHAFIIALRLGIDPRIIERAHEISYGEKKDYTSSQMPDTIGIIDPVALQQHQANKRIQEQRMSEKAKRDRARKYAKKDFKIGDSVYISTMGRHGIVCEEENEKGNLTVLVMGKKVSINNKRLSLYIDRQHLYPENYDMDIVFESKENRKKRKLMHKRHVEGLVIEQNPDDE